MEHESHPTVLAYKPNEELTSGYKNLNCEEPIKQQKWS